MPLWPWFFGLGGTGVTVGLFKDSPQYYFLHGDLTIGFRRRIFKGFNHTMAMLEMDLKELYMIEN